MPRRLMMVAASNRRRGAEVFTEELARGLRERGWDVDAVSLTSSSEQAIVDLLPLTQVDPDETGRLDLGVLRALVARVRATTPDVILAMGGPTLRYSVAAAGIGSIPIAYFAIGEPRYWLRSALSERVNRLLLKRVDRILAVSAETRSQLVSLFPGLEEKTVVAHTGVREAFFEVQQSRRSGMLRSVLVGSLSNEKDPELAIRAVARAQDVRLRLVGSGPLQTRLSALIDRLGLSDRVELAGAVDDLCPVFADADVLLLTSRTEGLPGVVLEAAAAGVPTVGVDVGGVAEAVEHQSTGILVERDEESLALALNRLSADPEGLRAMAAAARERARGQFTLEAAIDRFEASLAEMLP